MAILIICDEPQTVKFSEVHDPMSYKSSFVELPCFCGQWDCDGVAIVENNESAIKAHNDLYGIN